MLKAVLQCTDCLDDFKNINCMLAQMNVTVLKSKRSVMDIKVNITIVVDDYTQLNHIVYRISQLSIYGISIVKVKDLNKSWFYNILLQNA